MADVHVLERFNGRARLALHFPVPPGNNAAGVPWSTALLNSGRGGTTILPDGDGTAGTISAAEKASILAGTLYEVVDEAKLLSAGTAPNNLNAYLDAFWTRRRTETLAELQAALNYYGRTRDVP